MENQKINGTDTVRGDIFDIIIQTELTDKNVLEPMHKGILITIYASEEYGKTITFDDIVAIANKNGFSKGVFRLIAENPLEGTIYQYANCYDCPPFWTVHGSTRGYA